MSRKPRTTKKTTTTSARQSDVVRFPNNVLGYLEVAVEGPLGPDGVAHRRAHYSVTRVDDRGRQHPGELIGAACGPTTTQPGPNHATDPDDTQTIPVTVCRSYSAAFAQLHGVIRCTHDACFPLRPNETANR